MTTELLHDISAFQGKSTTITLIFYFNYFYFNILIILALYFHYFNTLRTGDPDLRFYVTTVQDG